MKNIKRRTSASLLQQNSFSENNALSCKADEVTLWGHTEALGRRILGKPKMLTKHGVTSLSGRRHRVITAIAVRNSKKIDMEDVVNTVKFKVLSKKLKITLQLAIGLVLSLWNPRPC